MPRGLEGPEVMGVVGLPVGEAEQEMQSHELGEETGG